MIQKVSKQNSPELLESGSSFTRDSVNKSAMSAFEVILVKTATEQLAKGVRIEVIASNFGLKVQELQNILATATNTGVVKVASSNIQPEMKKDVLANRRKTECGCDNDALTAYNDLHGIKAQGDIELDTRTGKSVHSAMGNQSVTDIGGPKKQIKFQSSNSIWDSEVLDRQLKKIGNDERIKAEIAANAKQREEAKHASRYQTISGENLADVLKETEQRKTAGVHNLYAQEAHKYSKKLPANGISIFDSEAFERLQTHTDGEKIGIEKLAAANAPKDRSWINNNKSLTSKDLFNAMIDSLIDDKE